MYVRRGVGAQGLARIFANLSRRPGEGETATPDAGIVRLPRPPETDGKRRVA